MGIVVSTNEEYDALEASAQKEVFEKYKDILARHNITSPDNLYWELDDIIFDATGISNPEIPDDLELIENISEELDEKMPMMGHTPVGVCVHSDSHYHYEPSYFDRSNVLEWIFFGCILLYGAFVVLGHIL